MMSPVSRNTKKNDEYLKMMTESSIIKNEKKEENLIKND